MRRRWGRFSFTSSGECFLHSHTTSTNNSCLKKSKMILADSRKVYVILSPLIVFSCCCLSLLLCCNDVELTVDNSSSLPPLLLAALPAFNIVQGQLASRDGVPLYPCRSSDINQGDTGSQAPRSCDLLAHSLAALQTHVCLRSGEAHVTLSHVVGPYRYEG